MDYEPKTDSFFQFIWNGDKKEFLGRTGSSWARIGFFYLLFYSFLACWFAAFIYFFMLTVDPKLPRYQPGDGGSILQNPAMGYLPRPREDNIESTIIWFQHDSNESIRHWVTELDDLMIDKYESVPSNAVPCSNTKGPDEGEVCQFSESMLGTSCSRANRWGFTKGSPCVLLKLNKMIHWQPDVYTSLEELPAEMPARLREEVEKQTKANAGVMPKLLWVSCTGENPADDEYSERIRYFPTPGFPTYYFPYLNQENYSQPLVAVEFDRPERKVMINIECKLWAKNIVHSRKEVLGLIIFRLLVD